MTRDTSREPTDAERTDGEPETETTDSGGSVSEPGGASPESERGGGGSARVLPSVVTDNLLAKFVVGILVIVLLTAGIATYFYFGIDDQLNSQVETQIEETVGLHADIYSAWHGNRFDDVESVTADETLDVEAEQVRNDLLTRKQKNLERFDSFHLVDRTSGDILASSNAGVVGENFLEWTVLDAFPDDREFTTLQYTSASDETVVGFGRRRLLNRDHIVIGEVSADGGPEFRQTIENSETAVVNGNGTVLFGTESVDAAIVNPDNESLSSIRQDGFLHASTEAGNTSLFILTSTPSDKAFALRDSVLRSFIITLVLAFGVLTVVGVVGSRSVVNALTTLEDRAKEMEEGNLDVTLQTSRTDEIGDLSARFANMRDSLRERITEAETALDQAKQARTEAETAREDAEDARRQAEEINEQIEASADRYSEVMKAAANNDLGVRMEPDEDNEAMAAIAREFNAMLDEFETTITEIKQFADEVVAASEQVTASSRDVKRSSETVSEAVQTISDGSVQQNESLQEITEEMDDLSAVVEEIAASSDEVATNARETAEISEEGRAAAQEAIEGMRSIKAESGQAVDEIERLESRVNQVDDLITRISDIAEQTSILALNANIEAARAGDGSGSGDGFAVVANEVKALSEDAKKAADEVEESLEEIRTQTTESARVVQATSEGVDEYTESVENAADALATVAEHAAETNDGVQEISDATDRQADSTERVVASVREVASIADETTDEAEKTAATAEEQTASMNEVSQSATELAEQAQQLSEALARFETADTHTNDTTGEEPEG